MSKLYMKNAFTLVEIFLTLLVIGITTSLVIPNLSIGIQQENYNTGAKTAMADLQKALNQMISEGNEFNFFETGNTDVEIINAFGHVFNYVRTGPMVEIFPNGAVYRLYKSSKTVTLPNYSSAVLSNGRLIRFGNITNGCTYNFPSDGSGLTNICADVVFDINGQKSPNMLGMDLYYFFIGRKGNTYVVIPLGTHNDGFTCVTNSQASATSKGCAAYRVLDRVMP